MNESIGAQLRKRFIRETQEPESLKALCLAVEHPNGAVEMITNYTHLKDKVEYVKNRYDEEFKMVGMPGIKIVGYLAV